VGGWLATLRRRDAEREEQIAAQAAAAVSDDLVNPLHLCREIESLLAADSVIVADGGDFVGTAAYVLRPRAPLSWLDPGVFGTLGVGGGFALGAKLCRPASGRVDRLRRRLGAYSLAEFDAMARHGLPVIAVVGNDAGWAQIAREQVEMLHDDVGTVLARTDYHRVAAGYGGKGLRISRRPRWLPCSPRRCASRAPARRCWSTPCSGAPTSARARSRSDSPPRRSGRGSRPRGAQGAAAARRRARARSAAKASAMTGRSWAARS
jgi:thiamine pyrophosphate-dependent acetolactate synthase large subunit-like protein